MSGFRVISPWTMKPVPGIGRYDVKLPPARWDALRRLAKELSVPFDAVLFAAHAKVLGVLSSEIEVSTGYAVEAGKPLLRRLSTGGRTWRELLLETAAGGPEAPGASEPRFETLFEPPQGRSGKSHLDEGKVLRVVFVDDDGLVLQLYYNTEVLDAGAAARIAGYHIAALSLMAADPDAEHARQSLLSAGEMQLQIHGLAGPYRELPSRRAHELFEDRVRSCPDAVAASHGERHLTYRELNSRSNQVARALLARGLLREGIVGVVTERNLDWMTSVLGIFKAGGAYLPIEPHFPADRIRGTLSRAGCRLVLTERGSSATLDRALESLSGIEKLYIESALQEGHSDLDPEIRAEPDQLAYIYFTSGSTGEPKGAMCEHAGMLNHLLAKVWELQIGEGDVVAQTAPQCFDISMWQLISALLAGGRTVIIEQETILDAKRFVDKIAAERVAVVQVVPSYLEVLVSYLAQNPRELPGLRIVSATGEALKKELVQRWFAVQPGIKLLNAYGLTETSDDTNHEIMEGIPTQERVPLGRPIQNVRVYVVDQHLSPVPLGAPGEIVFSGVCVGRGYINDPERTQRAFLPDPHVAGARLYRSGDYGRWLPDGKLEFLGRKDTQVKVSGFRIEIGEIEERLLQLPGIREGAVVVSGREGRSKRLAAFYSADRELEPSAIAEKLGESLPAYMIPSAYHWRQSLPVTNNGKIDRKALTALARENSLEYDRVGEIREAPRTPTEQRLAAAWAVVLGISEDQIGRQDGFFDLGGTSLSAVRLAISLERALSFRELADHPILADQASLIDRKGVQVSPVLVPGGSCASGGNE